MRARSFTLAILTTAFLASASCGSVATRSDAGGTGGVIGQGTGGGDGQGTGGVGGQGTGGSSSTDAGQTGTGGSSSGGAGGSPGDGGILVWGGLGAFGPAPASTGAIRVVGARLQPTPTCSGNTCVSGGLVH